MPMDPGTAISVLVADDDVAVRDLLRALLTTHNYRPLEAEDGRKALEIVRSGSPDVVLLDIRMPGLSGLEVLDEIHRIDPELPVVMITALDDVETAVEAMRRGAYHYLRKPFSNAEVLAILQRAVEQRRLRNEVRSLQGRLEHLEPIVDLLGADTAAARLLAQVERAARADGPVLIIGEQGTGKELLARSIHARSGRSEGPFVAVDCGALSPVESDAELFGRESGAEAEAGVNRVGELGRADTGTLYLADIGSLPSGTQDRLAAFLHDSVLQRIGAKGGIPVDIRIIGASPVGLGEFVDGGLFHRDLYAYLAQAVVVVPPLRERKDDIVSLVNQVCDATNQELGRHVDGPSPEALEILLAHPWPGNLRELRHVIRRAVLLADKQIQPEDLNIASPCAAAPEGAE